MRLAATIGLVCAAVVSAMAQDWAQWRGPNRDGSSAAFTAPAEWPDALTLRWSVPVGQGDSSPILSGGRLYLLTREGDEEVVTAFSADDGRTIWQDRYAAPFPSCLYNDVLGRYVNAGTHGVGGAAPKSTPLYRDGQLFTLGIGGALTALDAETGELLWRNPAPPWQGAPMVGEAMSPLVDDDIVIVHMPGAQQAIKCQDRPLSDARGPLAAYDVATGEERWRWDGDGASYSSPIIGTFDGQRQLITISERRIVGIDPATGRLLWERPLQSPDDQNIVSPVLYGDTIIYGALENPITALRPTRVGDTWTTDKTWENPSHALFMNTPVVVGDRAYGFSYKLKGHYFSIDARTGETLWSGPGRMAENVAIVHAGGLLFLLENDAELVVARPTEASFEEIRRYTVADSPTWAHPVLDGTRIYVREAEKLNAWDLE